MGRWTRGWGWVVVFISFPHTTSKKQNVCTYVYYPARQNNSTILSPECDIHT